jgi:site-specific DNA-cytosine methylase
LSSQDFGVPQDRRRLFVIGIRKDVAEKIGIRSDEDVLQVFPKKPYRWVTIRSALSSLRQREEDIAPWRKAMMTSPLGQLVAKLPADPPKKIGLKDVAPEIHNNFSLTRCAWDQPAPTLVVIGQKPDGMAGTVHPSEDRKFTLAELRRLFGLPDDYVLTGNLSQGAERVCRMVTPFVVKAIAESVYEQVLRPYRKAIK